MDKLYREYLHIGGHETVDKYPEIYQELGVDVLDSDAVKGSTFALIAMLIHRVNDLEKSNIELKSRVHSLEAKHALY